MFPCFQHCIAGNFCSPENFEKLFCPDLTNNVFPSISTGMKIQISSCGVDFQICSLFLCDQTCAHGSLIHHIATALRNPPANLFSTHAQQFCKPFLFMKCSEIRAENGGCLLLYHVLSLVHVKYVLVFLPLPFSTFEMFC